MPHQEAEAEELELELEEAAETIVIEHGDTRVELDDPTRSELAGLVIVGVIAVAGLAVWVRRRRRRDG